MAQNAVHLNLQRLLVIRIIVFAIQLAALLYASAVLALPLNYPAILLSFTLLAVLNAGLYVRINQKKPLRAGEFFIHLLLDVAGLSILLYLTGGASNPFVSYFLVPITIAAATIGWRQTFLIATLALSSYTLLLFYYQPLPALMPDDSAMHVHGSVETSSISLHIIGMWFNFLVSAALITWFVTKMAAEISRQQGRISQYREDTLRDEQILAVATQAAGTAHELGTPLSTMAVVLKDIQREYPAMVELQADLGLLQQQVEHCRASLQTLASKADVKNLQPETLALGTFITRLLDHWQLLRPEQPVKLEMASANSPAIVVDITLQQALINILNNAADACNKHIIMTVSWDDSHWKLTLLDDGPGISRELREQLGISISSTKPGGMGVGLVLSQATINRLGGSVSLFPRDEGGTLTEVILPLAGTIRKLHD